MLRRDRFVRVPTDLLQTLLRMALSGAQWRVILWVIRNTLGWNRETVPFSWYRVARELGLDRGGVSRVGNGLIRAGILFEKNRELGMERDYNQWRFHGSHVQGPMTPVNVDARHLKPMTGVIATDDGCHLGRGQASSLFRRAKDSSKERSKTYKESGRTDDARHRSTGGMTTQRPALAGAAAPIPGKYDSL